MIGADMTIEEWKAALQEAGIPCSAKMEQQTVRYAEMLKEWNQKFNLTAVDEPEEVYEIHMLDSLLPLARVQVAGRVCDVGSGAGFPGMVWAIARDDLEVVLLEPTGKRCTFLNAVKEELGLDHVTVVNRRAEDCRMFREGFDTVTARAVANLSVLSELCVPLVKAGGSFVSLKGSKGAQELSEAAYALKVLGCNDPQLLSYQLPSGEGRTLIVCEKTSATPSKYPRPFGTIKHSPLKEK